MPYIGNQTSTAFTSMAKQDITGNGGASYTLTHAVANEQEIEVYVNNVRQEPGTAYTVSGTTLTMTGNVASTDDFYVVYQGKAIQTSVPGDNTVTTAMLQDSSVATAKIADTGVTTAKIAANAVTAAKMFSGFENGVEFFETYRLRVNTNSLSSGDFDSDWELVDTDSGGKLVPGGTGMSESSGIWTFPATGMYLVMMHFRFFRNGVLDYMEVFGNVTTNNSTYTEAMNGIGGWGSNNATTYASVSNHFIFDVTDTTTHKMKFTWAGSHAVAFSGDSNSNSSNVTFIRIGDT